MSIGTFWKGLAGIILLTAAVLWGLDLLVPASDALGVLSLISTTIFIAILIGAYYFGQMAIRSASKSRFIQLVMMIIVIKMLVCVLIIAVYVQLVVPDTKLFVIPFLLIYLIFTIFEVIVLERIARTETSGELDQSTK